MNRLILLACLLGLAASGFADSPHTFIYHPSDHPRKVDVAGTFNNWSDTANPMQRQSDGSFAATLTLPDGIYQYKFVVNGDQWLPDPNSDKELEDAADTHHNSAVMVGPDARNAPAPLPNDVNMKFVRHDPNDETDLNVVDDHHIRFRIRTLANDVQQVSVTMRDGELKKTTTASLFRLTTASGFDVFGGLVEAPGPNIQYYFTLIDGTQSTALDPDNFNVSVKPRFQTPDWAENAVWYQIFPERFRNGDPANDPPHTVRWQSKWFSSQPGETPGEENFYKGAGNIWNRRYGGDVQGLIQSLPYLKSLGITAIYLNPMFEADSLHKYDTSDYRHIDEHFGFKGDIEELEGETEDPATWQWTKTDKLFLDFVAKAHAMGFKVVLDGVFNHVGRDFWAFKDVLKNGKNSKYAGWFDVRDWNQPIKYIAWDRGEPSNDGSLPIFKKDARLGLVHGPREHVLAVAKRWLAPDGDPSRGIDGFRLDVANDVPHPFWQEFRKELKAIKPDCYITGEIWTWAQPWLKGNEFDAVMNYRFAVAEQDFYVRQKKAITPSAFNDRLNEMIYAYPLQVSLDQMNLLDSHDTDRFASMIVNSDLGFKEASRLQEENGKRYSIAKPDATQLARMEQALVTQFTFLGAPMIYYGDEVGMWSADDPSNRQPMIWKDLEPYDDSQVTFNQPLFDWYQRLIAIRRSMDALRLGFYRPVVMDDVNGIFVYARDLGTQHVYIVVNRSPTEHDATFAVEPAIKYLWNFLSARDAVVGVVNYGAERPQARPTADVAITAKGISPVNGTVSVHLAPWDSLILTEGVSPEAIKDK
jgi:cyclomaltodextrinase / maltogenic alpha-amylase / neopullulanase